MAHRLLLISGGKGFTIAAMSTRRRVRWIAGVASLVLLLGPGVASAGTILPGDYFLLDHGDGSFGPSYGLRVDATGDVFSVELGSASVILSWDGGTTATIAGTLNLNTAGGNGGVGDTWTVLYTLTGVSAVGTLGFVATGGSGTLTDPFNVVTNITGEADGAGNVFEFLADGHRIEADSDTPVGRGWLLPPDSVDDWIVRAVLVPEPGTASLVCVGLIGLSAYRSRATQPA